MESTLDDHQPTWLMNSLHNLDAPRAEQKTNWKSLHEMLVTCWCLPNYQFLFFKQKWIIHKEAPIFFEWWFTSTLVDVLWRNTHPSWLKNFAMGNFRVSSLPYFSPLLLVEFFWKLILMGVLLFVWNATFHMYASSTANMQQISPNQAIEVPFFGCGRTDPEKWSFKLRDFQSKFQTHWIN